MTLLAAAGKGEGWEGKQPVATWLYALAHNVVMG